MAYRLVYTDFWTDPKVLEEMTPEDKYFYLYLLTNPNTNMIGIYKITKKQIAFELGYSIESVNCLFDRFTNNYKLIKYDAETREIFIKNYAKYNLNKGGKPINDCIKKELKSLKNVDWLKEVVDIIPNENIRDTVREFLKTGIIKFEASKPSKTSTPEDYCYDTDTTRKEDCYESGGNQNQNQNQNQNHNSIPKGILSSTKVQLIIEKWNKLNLQKLISIKTGTNRYKLLKSRANEYGIDSIFQAIENVSKSNFLKGQNDRGWIITFDWLIKPNNFIKVLEGNYSNHEGGNNGFNTTNSKPNKYNIEIPKPRELTEEEKRRAEKELI